MAKDPPKDTQASPPNRKINYMFGRDMASFGFSVEPFDSGDAALSVLNDIGLASEKRQARPQPIGFYVPNNGKRQIHPVYEPLPGLEYLFNGSAPVPCPRPKAEHSPVTKSQDLAPLVASPEDVGNDGNSPLRSKDVVRFHPGEKPEQPKKPSKKVFSKSSTCKPRGIKRARPVIEGESRLRSVATTEAFTFHIGDEQGLKVFLEKKFDELGTKPLKRLCTEWVKKRWPDRRRWPYTEGTRPPGWPTDAKYREPSHIGSKDLRSVSISIVMDCRTLDEKTGKARINWIKTLKETSDYILNQMPAEEFGSSTSCWSAEHNTSMKKRAKELILPVIFDVAQSYEDHVAAYGLYEDRRSEDPNALLGKSITWTPVPRPSTKAGRTKKQKCSDNTASQSPNTPEDEWDGELADEGDDTETSVEHIHSSGPSPQTSPVSRMPLDVNQQLKIEPQSPTGVINLQGLAIEQQVPQPCTQMVALEHVSMTASPFENVTPMPTFMEPFYAPTADSHQETAARPGNPFFNPMTAAISDPNVMAMARAQDPIHQEWPLGPFAAFTQGPDTHASWTATAYQGTPFNQPMTPPLPLHRTHTDDPSNYMPTITDPSYAYPLGLQSNPPMDVKVVAPPSEALPSPDPSQNPINPGNGTYHHLSY